MRTPLVAAAVFLTAGCSTMQLPPYPEVSSATLDKSTSSDGVVVVAQPLLEKELTTKYFGVDLLEKKILAIHITVRNNHPDISYTVRPEKIGLTSQINAGATAKPSAASGTAAVVTYMAGAVLLSPILLMVSMQQLSDATVIAENFETKRLRTRTIDPHQQAGGFAYFSWDEVKAPLALELCVELADLAGGGSSRQCVSVDLARR